MRPFVVFSKLGIPAGQITNPMRNLGHFLRAVFLGVSLSVAALAADSAKKPYDIPAGDAVAALKQFSLIAGCETLFAADAVRGVKTTAVKGDFTVQEAIDALLKGSGLSATIDAKTGAIAVRKETNPNAPRAASAPSPSVRPEVTSAEIVSLDAFVVTAEKKEERLMTVPVPVTAVSARRLVENNQLRLQDYFTKLPGVSLTYLGDVGGSVVSIRGINPGGNINPTVGVVVDDIPLNGAIAFISSAANLTPDIDPSELTMIEVLRGPQGTLYGASSMGGLIKYVTQVPSFESVSGRVQVGSSAVSGGEGMGYGARGSVNIPVSKTVAVRMSGAVRRDPGYIDNVQTGQSDINSIDANSARFSLLWNPSDTVSLQLNAHSQQQKRNGSSDTYLLAGLGEDQQSALALNGLNDQRYELYSAILKVRLGVANVTSLTGYSRNFLDTAYDLSRLTAYSNAAQSSFGVTGSANVGTNRIARFSQELRVALTVGEKVDWLAGVFYNRERHYAHADYPAVNPATGAVAGNLIEFQNDGSYEEQAAFSNVTVRLTDRIDVQAGLRAMRNEEVFNSVATPRAPVTPFGASLVPRTVAKDDAVTYLFTPRLKLNPETMIYARLSSGYRPGGPNTFATGNLVGAPTQYDHDTATTYDIGVKGTTLARRLTYDLSLYYIDWSDIQLALRATSSTGVIQNFTMNAGTARSQGAELSLALKPKDGLTISGWIGYSDATLTSVPANANLTQRPGDRLPYNARWSGNLSVDLDFHLPGKALGFAGASFSHIGDRKGRFFRGFAQEDFPGYDQLDLNAGARFAAWTLNAYVNNVTDKRGVLRRGRDSVASQTFIVTYTQPRTIGMSLTREF